MTRQEIYDSVVQLTADIKKTGVAEKIIEAAKTGDPEKVESVFEKFKEENADLNARIAKLYELRNYKEDSKIEVFGDDEGYFTFDPNIIDPLNFEILTFFIGIDDFDLIQSDSLENILDIIDDSISLDGYEELGEYLINSNWTDDAEFEGVTLYEILADIFSS